ncbi:helix-turn-helix domain-containing protein [Streptomyces sp. I4(2020)]|uniref:helix-turn-helix transcriptional regulator n=1 Tax=Streptomyces sp. I4(2020) TaxID=2760981 RepID=UPI0035A84798
MVHTVSERNSAVVRSEYADNGGVEPRTYRAGEQIRELWQGAVVRPGIPLEGVPAGVREGNVLRLRIPEFTDSAPGHWSRLTPGGDSGIGIRAPAPETAAAQLYRDGRKVADLADAWRDVEVPGGDAEYRLRLRTTRDSAEWARRHGRRRRHGRGRAPRPARATDRRLLALLVAGVADKAVATRMGLSRRTVQRRIQRLMELAGATTRMQLAWQAARRGWL